MIDCAQIPGLAKFLINSEYDWKYPLDPSPRFGLAYNRSQITAGKLLGGTGSINDMIYLRGNPGDYDAWASLGNPSWSFDKVLPYFVKSEDNQHQPFVKRKRNKFHSNQGPNIVDYFHSGDTSTQVFKDAARELHYEIADDLTAKEHLGFAVVQGIVKKGVRQSTAKSFLVPAKDRTNLHIIKKGLVTQVLLTEDEEPLATGVKLYVGGKRFIAKATKEVILSAGAIGTPHLLMLSGIGPVKNIRKYVKVRQNLPVGDNLQDHVNVPLFIKFNVTSQLAGQEFLDNYYNYLKGGIGSLGNVGAYDFTGFINTVDSSAKYPNIQFTHDTFNTNDIRFDAFLVGLDLKDTVKMQIKEIAEQFNTAVIKVVLLKPKSRGKVRLESQFAAEKPKVIAGHLASKQDMDTLLAGVRAYLKILDTKAVTSAGISRMPLKMDICDDFEAGSDAYWECYIMHFAAGAHHVVGTAKMGPETDKKAVVDPTLKVKGVKGLRVIDASVMPEIISSGTHAATMMIAEKGSDFVKESWSTKSEL